MLALAGDYLHPAPSRDPLYDQWIREREMPAEEIEAQRIRAQAAGRRPTISLVLGVLSGEAAVVGDAVRSVRLQTYPYWELCVVYPTVVARAVERAIELDGGGDARIRRTAIPGELTRWSARAAAAAQARGDFVAVIDPGDFLAPHALYEIARVFDEDPDVVYTDEDRFAAHGWKRELPALKPGWSPEMLLGYNYFGRLTVIRRERLVEVGGFRPDLESAQEWDVALRVAERTERIHHVPKVLCHRRSPTTPIRPAPDDSQAPFHRQALAGHLTRRGLTPQVETQPNGTQRATWPVTDPPLVSIIIPTRDNLEPIKECVDGLLRRTSYPRKEIVLVDTMSLDPAVHSFYDDLRQDGLATIVPFERDFNYSAACNAGARVARGELLLFLNNDIEVRDPGWLEEMVRFAELPGVGVVGAKLLYPEGTVQHAGVVIGMHICGLIFNRVAEGTWGPFGGPDVYRNYLAVMGACQMIRRDVFERVGGYDERYRIANSDVAICLRAWCAGARIVYTPYAALTHHEGLTRGRSNPDEDTERTPGDLLELGIAVDPYFHPDLSWHHPEPRLRVLEPVPWDTLGERVRHLRVPYRRASALDLFDDVALGEASAAHPWRWPRRATPAEAETRWGAVRFVVDLLRGDASLRKRFPHALSEGVNGAFCRWLDGEGGDALGLSETARERVAAAFMATPGRHVLQIYRLRGDLRRAFPLGLTPAGRRELLQWLTAHGCREGLLRLEEVWWFLLECAEDPAREVVRSYELHPEWQRMFPDALTIFGREAFAHWLQERHGITDAPWLDPARWPVSLTPLEEIRLGYAAHERWRRSVPDALVDHDRLRVLVAWLREHEFPSPEAQPMWWARLATEMAADGFVGLNVLAHFCYPSGLQASARSIVESLRRVGVRTTSRDVPTEVRHDMPAAPDHLGLEIYDVSLVHVQPEPFFETAYARAGLAQRAGVYRIGIWYWELETVPATWGRIGASLDEVWAPTRFIERALASVMAQPIVPMMPGVELGHFTRRPRSHFGLRDDRLIFLFMFDMASIMERKNPHALIEAFARAFRREESVQLVLKTFRGHLHPNLVHELRREAERVGALVIDEVLSREDSYALMQACDCYVSLHRSEGFGLTMAEAMLMGKPVIATGYSGNMDFMDEQNSLLVDCKVVALERDVPPYERGFRWGEPSIEHAVRHLRWVYEHRDDARALGERARQDVEQRLSFEAAGRRIAERLRQIRAARAGRGAAERE
jgi:GT2 family glycosyltransferase/glycosyltransferase involved in cell wall biosynthesis